MEPSSFRTWIVSGMDVGLEGGPELRCAERKRGGPSRETAKEGRGCSLGSPQSEGLEGKGPHPLVVWVPALSLQHLPLPIPLQTM